MHASQKALQKALLYFAFCGKSALFGQAIASEDTALSREYANRLVRGGAALTAEEEEEVFGLLSAYKAPLAKAGVKLPKALPDRLVIEAQGDGVYGVTNSRKGTSYTVELVGGDSTCTCPQFKFKNRCKHLDAVLEAYPPSTEALSVDAEPLEDDFDRSESVTSRSLLRESWGSTDDADRSSGDRPFQSRGGLADEAVEYTLIEGRAPLADIPEVLPGIALTQTQWQALQELEEFIEGDERLYLLTGYAGTGKSTLLQALVQRMRDRDDQREIALTAYTNKAKKVLESMSGRWDLDVTCVTCCQLLGIRPAIDSDTGQQVFRPDSRFDNQIGKFDLAIVDECSTIGEEMWQLLLKAVSGLFTDIKLLFVGDPAQLPPVNEEESPSFREISESSNLTEVVRYGNSIGRVAEAVRQGIDRPQMPQFQTRLNEDGSEGVVVTKPQLWHKSLIDVFKRSRPGKGGDFHRVRALAYTNRRVETLNRTIRQAIYGNGAQRFVVGERLMAHTPCLEEESILLSSSAECTVAEVELGRVEGWTVWWLGVLDEEGRYRQLRVLHESSQVQLQQQLQELADAGSWQEFWRLKNLFHDLRYAYALTVHKSQGSSFEQVYVDVRNIAMNRNAIERNKLCYVALTRAEKRVYILQ